LTTQVNKFPPKFSQNLVYPAIYNLKEYDIPNEYDFNSPGTYFTIQFPGYGLNSVPTLGFGKHAFDVGVLNYETQYNIYGQAEDGQYPPLKLGSRILIEVVDSNETVIFSDVTKIQHDYGFTGYLWIKQDPLRTYDDIHQGTGYIRIVGKNETTDPAYRNRYNVRVQLPINIELYNSNNVYKPNESPIIFQNTTGSMGSGSGLFISESIVQETNGADVWNMSYVHISQSKMITYSGEVRRLTAYYQISGSHDNFLTLQDLSLYTSSNYEKGIYKDYGQGINSLSEIWKISLADRVPALEDTTKIKFKLKFRNPEGDTALDYYGNPGFTVSDDFELIYPNESDEWLEFQGSSINIPADYNSNIQLNQVMANTGAGKFGFGPLVYGAPPGGNIGFDDNGTFNIHSNGPGDPGHADPPD
tara:strand:+ start:222 stop:1469 length:1248 start_codon:yes stop_codon:yes gene_type:complete